MIRKISLCVCAAALSTAALAQDYAEPAEEASPQITLGNGENSAILVDGATRIGATFRFPTIKIDRNGFLVMHPVSRR